MPIEPLRESGLQTFGLIRSTNSATLAEDLERVAEPFVPFLAMDASAVPIGEIDSLA